MSAVLIVAAFVLAVSSGYALMRWELRRWGRERARAQATILRLLGERPSAYGLDLVAASGGVLGKGTIYVHLHRLEERGLVRSWPVDPPRDGMLPRRLYSLVRS